MKEDKRAKMEKELQKNFNRKEYEKRVLESLKKAKDSTKNYKESKRISEGR